jgi:hypothetical protein
MKLFVFSLSLILFSSQVYARPIITEPLEPIGRASFEAGMGISNRIDQFGSPITSKYSSVIIPAHATVGLHDKLDFGFSLTHASHRLETGGEEFKGSRPAMLAPEIKFVPWSNLGFQFIWRNKISEEDQQNLPIARGDDLELITLIKLPVDWPAYINVGYLVRDSYTSKLGIEGGQPYTLEPGNVLTIKTSVEYPLRYGLKFLTEAAYYSIEKGKVSNSPISESDGSAADIFAGITWAWGGWNIGSTIGFGLLDESRTSFSIDRGAGDYQYNFSFSYKLKAKKPGA